MRATVLIDAIVRQTMILIAHLATVSGTRAPLTGVVDHVFVELVGELRRQGLSPQIIADMFGIAIRTYHSRVRRLSDQFHDTRRSLWQKVFTQLRDHGPMPRARLLDDPTFRAADEGMLRSVLHDLVDSGLVYQSGRGGRLVYGALPPDVGGELGDDAALQALVRVAVFHLSPVTALDLAAHLGVEAGRLAPALAALEARGCIAHDPGSPPRYHCRRYLVPLGSDDGREAAIYDHFQAMVHAICQRVGDTDPERTGGSTFAFDIWPGHPCEDEVTGLLAEVRARVASLRRRVDAHNDALPAPGELRRVVFYCGQSLRADEDG